MRGGHIGGTQHRKIRDADGKYICKHSNTCMFVTKLLFHRHVYWIS